MFFEIAHIFPTHFCGEVIFARGRDHRSNFGSLSTGPKGEHQKKLYKKTKLSQYRPFSFFCAQQIYKNCIAHEDKKIAALFLRGNFKKQKKQKLVTLSWRLSRVSQGETFYAPPFSNAAFRELRPSLAKIQLYATPFSPSPHLPKRKRLPTPSTTCELPSAATGLTHCA